MDFSSPPRFSSSVRDVRFTKGGVETRGFGEGGFVLNGRSVEFLSPTKPGAAVATKDAKEMRIKRVKKGYARISEGMSKRDWGVSNSSFFGRTPHPTLCARR